MTKDAGNGVCPECGEYTDLHTCRNCEDVTLCRDCWKHHDECPDCGTKHP